MVEIVLSTHNNSSINYQRIMHIHYRIIEFKYGITITVGRQILLAGERRNIRNLF